MPSRKVVLIEPPICRIHIEGVGIPPCHPRYLKYGPLLVLEHATRAIESGIDATIKFMDLKSSVGSAQSLTQIATDEFSYEGRSGKHEVYAADFDAFVKEMGSADVLAISASFSFERKGIELVIALAKQANPKLTVVVGGHDATADPKTYLEMGANYCALGEGEAIIGHILANPEKLENYRGFASVSGGSVKKSGRAIIDYGTTTAPVRPSILSRHGAKETADGPAPIGVSPNYYVLETSRGCNERCSFCSSPYIAGKYRLKSLESVLVQIDYLHAIGIRTILFADDNLLYRLLPDFDGDQGRKDLITMFEYLFAKDFSWHFYNGIQLSLLARNEIADHELIEAMFRFECANSKARGCYRAYFPLEKFYDKDVARLPKLLPEKLQAHVIAAISATGPGSISNGFIIGTPDDTPETFASVWDGARRFGELITRSSSGKTAVTFSPWCSVPLPATTDAKRYSNCINYSLREHPYLYSNSVSVMSSDRYTPLDFTLLREELELRLNSEFGSLHPGHC